MHVRRWLSLATVSTVMVCAVFGLGTLLAQANPDTTLTINVTGTVGAVLSGSDPLGASGESGVVTAMVSESLSPTKTTATSATYTLPPGAVRVAVGAATYTTKSASLMKITLPAKGPDVMVLSATGKELGIQVSVLATMDLKHGSFPSSALIHPAPFRPSPQTLTAATGATGTGSKIQYTVFGSTTVLGFTGAASDKAALDLFLPEDDDSDQ